jgi:phospholipase/carboxylesterase
MSNPRHDNGFDFWLYPTKLKKPDSLIVILHGHGSNAAIYESAAELLQRSVPGADVIALQAPVPFGQGFTWFDYEGLKHGNKKVWLSQIFNHLQIADKVNSFTMAQLQKRGLTPDDLALIGNSLGGITALQAGFHSKNPPAAVVSQSGAVLPFTKVKARPEILLLMGDKDEIFHVEPPRQTGLKKIFAPLAKRLGLHHRESLRRLKAKGVSFTEKLYPGGTHSLPWGSWQDSADFVAGALRAKKSPAGPVRKQ